MRHRRSLPQSSLDNKYVPRYASGMFRVVMRKYGMSIEVAEITKQRYLRNEGACCLFCGSNDIESGSYKTDGNWVAYEIECDNCGATWDDLHILSEIDNITLPTKEFQLKGGKFCESCGESMAVHNDDGSCVEPMWREIDFGDDIQKAIDYHKDCFEKQVVTLNATTLSKAVFEMLCGPLDQLAESKGWRVDHFNATIQHIESWTVWIDDEHCICIMGERK